MSNNGGILNILNYKNANDLLQLALWFVIDFLNEISSLDHQWTDHEIELDWRSK